LQRGADPRARGRTERAARSGPASDRRGAERPPAARADRARRERRPDRRARGATEHKPRRALQDIARRAAQASLAPGGAGTCAGRPVGGPMTTNRPDSEAMLGRILGPAEPELGCDDCFEWLDRYVELEAAGVDADVAVPGLRAHLDGCPA